MAILKELQESHESIKAIALVLLLIPFWYVSIFMFNNEFYKAADSIITVSMCIVISLISSFLFQMFLSKIKEPNNKQKTFFDNMLVSVALLIIWLSALIFIIYSLGFLFKTYIYFYWFLVIYFAPIIILIILQNLFQEKNTQLNK